jgi:hypothetical protein
MSIILRKPDLSHFTISDHLEYHKISYSICDKYGAIINAPELITGYSGKVTQEEHIYNWVRRSEYTAKKAGADNERDRLYTGITSLVRTQLKHFDPAIRNSAQHVHHLLGNYGDLRHAGYDAETAAIDSVVRQLNSPAYSLAVQALGIASWIAELANKNALFKSYADNMAQEQIDKPHITFRQSRRKTDEAFRRILNRITSLIELNGPDAYAVLAEELNIQTNHYNILVHERYGRLHVKTDIKLANIAPIEVQRYTGKPVYVIPAVSIIKVARDGSETVVELIFSEDFTVTYKNNVHPGTATLYVKGTGKYTGKIITTFNII